MKIERLETKFVRGSDETEVAAGTFSGYGAVFGNVDAYGDVIAKGAFKETLREWKRRGSAPKMLLQHGSFLGPAEDAIPIGKWDEIREDDTGLFVKGALFALDTQKGKYIHEGLRAGALDGLSIGYVARDVAFGKKPEDPKRTLKRVDLFEISIVTFPANEAARVDAVKSIEEIQTLADAEAWLRDAAGLTRAQALAFVSRVKGIRLSDSELPRFEDLTAALNRAVHKL